MTLIVAIAGEAGCGKDTLIKRLLEHYCFYSRYIASKFGFADPIREAACSFFGCDINKLNDREFKETIHPVLGISPRKFMQDFGMWARENINENVWVTNLRHRLQREQPNIAFINDLRFGNELNFVKAQPEKLIIKLIRPDNPLKISSAHISEKEIANEHMNYIFTAADLNELNLVADSIIHKISKLSEKPE